jgi:endoglucanase
MAIFIACNYAEHVTDPEDIDDPEPEPVDLAVLRDSLIGRGINFGNALESPNEGDWGLTIKESYIEAVKEAGFNSVRFPICWSAHTSKIEPYHISPQFLARVDQILDWCFQRNLVVIITIHHFNELYDDPENAIYRSMFKSIWKQLSVHYLSTSGDQLIFEPLNEPHGNLTAEKWNLLMPEIIDEIRSVDTLRTLILDVPDYGNHNSISKLSIPITEKNAIVSVRYYLPYPFTHQGAHWVSNSDQWLGTTWRGTTNEKNTVLADLAVIKAWSDINKRPVTVGEFGSIIYADSLSRTTWTRYVRQHFEVNNFSWSYFDFGVLFKAYDLEKEEWIKGFPEAFFD